jgi:hypothetical protein
MVTKEAGNWPVSCIVRIYRSDPPEEVAGTVEIPELGERLTFANLAQLESILLAACGVRGAGIAARRPPRAP